MEIPSSLPQIIMTVLRVLALGYQHYGLSKLIQSVFALSLLCSMDPLSANAQGRCRWPRYASPPLPVGICRIPWCPDPPEYDHVIGKPGPDDLHSTVHELPPVEQKALEQARLLVSRGERYLHTDK